MNWNIFIPQSCQTRIELEEIVAVERQIITPATNRPIIGIVQDGLLGAYNLTQPSMKIDWKSAMNIMSYTTLDDFSKIKKNTDHSGTDLFSLIIPSKVNMTGSLEIKNGQITKGILNKQALGAKRPNNIIHLIWDEYGVDETKKFIDNTQRLINNFNLWNGFSVGIGDIDVPTSVEDNIHKLIETKKLEIDHLITEMENNPDLVDMDVAEQTIAAELGVVRDEGSKMIMAHLKADNSFNIMITSGSKGEASNMGQMGACLGQQNVEAKRIAKKLNGRSLPYFHQGDDTAKARGFVEQPFVKGIKPINFIFHNMASREGLIDTAIKSVTGDTPIIISDDGNVKRVLIGEWIDERLVKSEEQVEHYKERDMELLKIPNDKIYIPTTDENGNVSWGLIEAITRHDPGKELYEIKTHGGRQVIVTESKSLLIWNNENNKFERMSTPDVKTGDYVPVTMTLNKPYIRSTNNIELTYSLLGESANIIQQELNKYVMDKIIKNDNYDQIICESNEEAVLVNILYNRLGIYTRIDDNKVIIENPDILQIQNDVVLDKIISINKVDVTKYPKVYDLTVPSTLNFGLANGLHVVDTAESGYIQRKLIKSMEDLCVKYDNTVRSSNNTILQFTYGDNGIETTRQYDQELKMLEMSNKEISDKIKFSEQELKNFKFTNDKNNKFYKKVLELRDSIRSARMRTAVRNITFDSNFKLPINIKNIINIVKNSDLGDKNGNLEPDYILEKLKLILRYESTRVLCMNNDDAKNKKSLKYKDEMLAKTIVQFALYEFLSPKVCIFDHKLNKAKFDKIYETIIERFNKAIVEAGEMVGIIAAQSIGEPTTQLERLIETVGR